MIDESTPRLDEGALHGFGRDLIPRVLAGLVRRGEDFDAAEDALQEALLEALRVWPEHPPRDPAAWLATVATRQHVDPRPRAAPGPPPGENTHAPPAAANERGPAAVTSPTPSRRRAPRRTATTRSSCCSAAPTPTSRPPPWW